MAVCSNSSCDALCSNGSEEVLCDYVKMRLENIEKKLEMTKPLGLLVHEVEARTKSTTVGAGGMHGRRKKEKRKYWSASESKSGWESWMSRMHVQTSSSTHKTKLRGVEHLEMQDDKDREDMMERGCVIGNQRHRKMSTRIGVRRGTRLCHGTSSLLEVTLPDCSDLLDREKFDELRVEDWEVPNDSCNTSLLCDDGGSGEFLLREETLADEAEFTEQGIVLTSDVPNFSTPAECGEAFSEDDDYLFCDDCNEQHPGDCPVHGPLSELDPTAGYDQASVVYTQLPVPAQLTIRPSGIPGAGLGVFAASFINTGIRIGLYEGKNVSWDDVGDLHNMAYVWEIKHKETISHLIDGQDPSCSNWMRFVNCARHEDEQNVLAYQYRGNIYYRTFKTIYPESELLVWYGENYAKELGIDLDTEASTPNFCCRGCGESFSEKTIFHVHLKQGSKCAMANPQTFTCLLCHQHFTQLEYLQQHIKKHENLAKEKQCTYCGKSFSRKSDLHRHLRTHTGDKPYKCEVCGKSFSLNGNLQQHLRTHAGDKPCKCEYCGKSFCLNGYLQKHLRTHTEDKPFKCVPCGKSFCRNVNLQVHLRKHTGNKQFKCVQCGTSFCRNDNLQVHLRTHTGYKPFKCEHCGKCFCRSDNLQVHLRTHTGYKPYKCEHCGKSFSRKSILQTHVRTHTGEKPFKCVRCGKSFSRNDNLQVHLRTHTGDKPAILSRDVNRFGI